MKLLESLRDRVVLRSQIGKRKLDRAACRRDLDAALRELGERYRLLVRTGKQDVPPELDGAMQKIRHLEDRLAGYDRELAELESEKP